MATATGFPISPDNRAMNTQVLSLPDPVLVALSIPGNPDPARFGAVIEAFGPLPIDGQVELVNRLIEARSISMPSNVGL
jgi:hypothetical protein